MILNRRLAVAGLLFLLLAGCSQRYEDGPIVSIYTPAQRITGKWKWAVARTVSGGRENNYSLEVADYVLDFKSDGNVAVSGANLTGTWNLISKKQELNLVLGPGASTLRIPPAIAFDLRLLRQNEMWLAFTDDSLNIEWQLRSIP